MNKQGMVCVSSILLLLIKYLHSLFYTKRIFFYKRFAAKKPSSRTSVNLVPCRSINLLTTFTQEVYIRSFSDDNLLC